MENDPEMTPALPVRNSKSTSPIIPILLGVVIVVIISAVLAGFYYFAKLKYEVSQSLPSSTPAASSTPTPEPTLSTSPRPSEVASAKPTLTPRSTSKPTSTPSPTPTSTAAPSNPTLDVRFGNPSANVKQTYDEGTGDGRVINREFSSVQVGTFDEVKTAWSPKITVCFHVVSNNDLDGNKLSYSISEDDKVVSEGTLSQYPKIEAGKLYDVCHDTTSAIGNHTLRLNLNNSKNLAEASYANNTARIDFKNLADNIPPNFTLSGPFDWSANGTCFLLAYASDNVTPSTELKVEHKIDSSDWTTQPKTDYCFKGNSGTEHTYMVRMTDGRGNKTEQSSTFKLY